MLSTLRLRGGKGSGSGLSSQRSSSREEASALEARRIVSAARAKLRQLRLSVRRRLSKPGAWQRLAVFCALLLQPAESVRLDQWASVRAPPEDTDKTGLRGVIIRRRRRANKVTQMLGVGYTPRIVGLAGLMMRGLVMSTGLPALFDPPIGLGIGSVLASRFTSREWLACIMLGWYVVGPTGRRSG